jgi:hypothetical protein
MSGAVLNSAAAEGDVTVVVLLFTSQGLGGEGMIYNFIRVKKNKNKTV